MQVSLKCAVAWLLAGLLMLGGIPALALEDYSDAWDAGQSGGGSSGASVNHIDIGVNVSVELVVDGVGKTETLTLTRADIQAADAFSITAAYGTGAADGAAFADFSYSTAKLETSTGSNGVNQFRIGGTFPVGTKSAPIYYTVTLKKTVTTTIDGADYDVPVTLVARFQYWDANNVCPPLKDNGQWKSGQVIGNSGMDFSFGTANGTKTTVGTLNVQKTVSGAALTEDHTYTFRIYRVDGETETLFRDNVQLTVPAGQTTAMVSVVQVPFGTYRVEEQASSAAIADYQVAVSYGDPEEAGGAPDCRTIGESDPSETFQVTNAYTPRYDEIRPDAGYIVVRKVFSGIAKEQIPADFAIVVSGDSGSWTLDWSGAEISGDGLTWTWRIDSAKVGTYAVTERNAAVADYALSTSGVGDSVEVSAGGSDFSVTKRETSCSTQLWPVNLDGTTNTVFLASLTGNEGTMVISRYPLRSGEQQGIRDAIGTLLNGSFKNHTVYFYDIETNGNGPYQVNGRTISYDPERKSVYIHNTKDWSMVAGMAYTVIGASTADITVSNAYTALTTRIAVNKVWVDGDDANGRRPESVTVRLYADGVESGLPVALSAENGWHYAWEALPRYREATCEAEIEYAVREDPVPYYASSVAPVEGEDGTYAVTNTYNPVDVIATKQWEDAWNDVEDYFGIRPDGIAFVLKAYVADAAAEGGMREIALPDGVAATQTTTGDVAAWNGLPRADADGNPITYRVYEAVVPDGYAGSATADNPATVGEDGTVTITNRLQTAAVTVKKRVTGSFGDVDKWFAFAAEATMGDGEGKRAVALPEAETQLKHGGEWTITVPVGASLVVSEDPDGYSASYVTKLGEATGEPVSGASAAVTAQDGLVIAFTNQKEAVPDTGVRLDSLPYIAILALAVFGLFAGAALRRRRRND